jgi:hypothetical protein
MPEYCYKLDLEAILSIWSKCLFFNDCKYVFNIWKKQFIIINFSYLGAINYKERKFFTSEEYKDGWN